MHLTLREVCEAFTVRGKSGLREEPEFPGATTDMNTVASGYSIDSRTLQPGDLFFAIRGPRFDGHDFVETALKKGACAVVVSEDWATNAPRAASSDGALPWIPVRDPAAALRILGRQVRRWWGGPVVAVTGSAGKTTTKEICAALLASSRRVYQSEGNLNNLLGVPLTLLRLDAGADVAVVELAMSAPEEIRQLTRIAEPNVGVVTNVNPVHLQFFSSIDEIALAKRELVEELAPEALAVLNEDDHRVSGFRDHTRARVMTYGERETADVRLRNIRLWDSQGSSFELRFPGQEWITFQMPLLGKHNVRNAGAAMAVASFFGVTPQDMRRPLEELHPAKMRGEWLRFAAGFVVIDDTYNSNPQALREMISVMSSLPGFQRKIVVAGEMLELGMKSRALHEDCGKSVADAGMDFLISVQGDAEALAEGARQAGMKSGNVLFYSSSAEAGERLCSLVRRGDLILLKASRGVRMEAALECLRRKFTMEVH